MSSVEKLRRILNNACGDDLERARAAFRGQAMAELHGQSGRTRGDILKEYEKEREEYLAAKQLLNTLLKRC